MKMTVVSLGKMKMKLKIMVIMVVSRRISWKTLTSMEETVQVKSQINLGLAQLHNLIMKKKFCRLLIKRYS